VSDTLAGGALGAACALSLSLLVEGFEVAEANYRSKQQEQE